MVKKIEPGCNRWTRQHLFVSYSEMFLLLSDRTHSICITLNLGVPLCRWIKYHGIKICGSGFLSSVASTLLGNSGHDNRLGHRKQEERGWSREGSRGRWHIPMMVHSAWIPWQMQGSNPELRWNYTTVNDMQLRVQSNIEKWVWYLI